MSSDDIGDDRSKILGDNHLFRSSLILPHSSISSSFSLTTTSQNLN